MPFSHAAMAALPEARANPGPKYMMASCALNIYIYYIVIWLEVSRKVVSLPFLIAKLAMNTWTV